MRTALACLWLVACGPGLDDGAGGGDGGELDPGSCDAPAEGAVVAIAELASVWDPDRLYLRSSGDPLACDDDILCTFHERVDADGALRVGRLEGPGHVENRCVCEEVAPDTWSGHCDESYEREVTALRIDSRSDTCITGVIERRDEPATPFVATICE